MRKSYYHDKFDRYTPKTQKYPSNLLEQTNIVLQIGKPMPQNNHKNHNPYYFNNRLIKPYFSRPATTNKTTNIYDTKRQSHDIYKIKSGLQIPTLNQRQSQVTKGSSSYSNTKVDQSKGRLYRGSSWRYDGKQTQQIISTTRSSPKRDRHNQQSGKLAKKTVGLFDLLGQNLKKSFIKPEQQFFQYVMRFSYRTKKGMIPHNLGKINQDNYIVSPNINSNTWQHLFGICDGHGPLGHLVSSFIKESLPKIICASKLIQKNTKQTLLKCFQNCYEKLLKQSGIDLNFSGSTIISCYLQHRHLYTANVGDSRAIKGRCINKIWETHALSIDHKPDIPKQAERIKKMKGRVQAYRDQFGQFIGPLRVWLQSQNIPGLAMTRSFGDLVGASVGVSPIPEIKQYLLTEQDKIIVIGSDGVFQFLSNEQIINSLVPFYQQKQIQQASDYLLSLAHKSWNKNSSIVDDITFIIIFLSFNQI